MIVAGRGCRSLADGAKGAAAGADGFDVADGFLFVTSETLVSLSLGWEDGVGKPKEREAGGVEEDLQQRSKTPRNKTGPPRRTYPRSRWIRSACRRGQCWGMRACSTGLFLHISKLPPPNTIPRTQLTTRVKALAAHGPRTKVICTAREDPCVAGSNILVKRWSEGHEDGGVGSESVGEEGGGGGVGCEGGG